uniref:Prefoldin subunit 1 n=1 Tax=Varanus komodoensis TaxID=61221 RepID=A0A8D2L1U8_VARKO
MAAPVGLKLKKALTELQAKDQKTDVEIMALADETQMYEGVGRMLLLQSKGVIHNQRLEKQKIAEETIKEPEQRKSYLERSAWGSSIR